MRLRNIPGAKAAITGSSYVVQNPEEWKGKWKQLQKLLTDVKVMTLFRKTGQLLCKRSAGSCRICNNRRNQGI